MHSYEVDAQEMEEFLLLVISESIDKIKEISALSKNRRQLLAYGAIVLIELIQCIGPKK
ncbi:exopolyphosphatase / guanosine-5'-triphosphate,3'-diphosphate pyrophosphatase [Bartonella sp. JB63]|nr:exopolyphosphatase / guanosine-5'-triphosphate,3'-diphosphate pyrophosphatase [Bartonella sp. JB15]AQX29217.1 exopolyphosphatase / guanosine-5'-triphosphate,3'-diphosphate pyrophosphatase [Bartonella sp. JB63]